MLSKITDKLWLGSELDSLFGAEYAMLSVAIEPFPRGLALATAKCGLIDGPGNDPAMYQAAIIELAGMLRQYPKVLCHCIEGVSRSPFIVACYLTVADGGYGDFGNWAAVVNKAHPPTNIRPEHLAMLPQINLPGIGDLLGLDQ